MADIIRVARIDQLIKALRIFRAGLLSEHV
jgi:hypothetical protein